MRFLHPIVIAALIATVAVPSSRATTLTSPGGVSQASGSTYVEYPVTPGGLRLAFSDWLKASYLRCELASKQESALDEAAAARCTVIRSALRERVFGGDFERFTEWLKTTRGDAMAQRRN